MTLLFHGKQKVPAHNYFLFQQTEKFYFANRALSQKTNVPEFKFHNPTF